MKANCFIILVSIIFISCNNKKNYGLLYDINTDSLNFLNQKRTNFFYKTDPVFSLNQINLGFNDFLGSNYIYVDGEKIYQLSIYSDCVKAYEKNNYFIRNAFLPPVKSECDIMIFPLLDFSIPQGDTIFYYTGHWLLLKNKFFDKNIKDTVYQFHREQYDESNIVTINATKRRGIIGVIEEQFPNYIYSEKKTCFFGRNYIGGKIVNNSGKPEDFIEPSFDLSVIKEFKRRKWWNCLLNECQ